MTEVSIACSLTSSETTDRLAEWRRFLGGSVVAIDAAPTRASLTLTSGDQELLTCVDLVEREKACCAFFAFSLQIEGNGQRVLIIEVPPDGAPVLAGLLALSPGEVPGRCPERESR
jgi:hypothetical protein